MDGLPWLMTSLASRWTRGLAGAAIASALIWYLFPLVPALRPPLPRVVAIVAVFAACVAVNGVIGHRRRRRASALAASVAGGRDARETQAEEAAEVAQIGARLRETLKRLQRRGRLRLYEQPWFVLIGPPGSGKTTALRNAGLHFPIDHDGGVSGVGGTRLCDWWFAEEAVLIDTAGRYTTQDSDAAIDRAGWQGFLDLLRRTRPRQPINGVIVVLSLTEIAGAEPAERSAHARAVRRRIDEITERLGQRVPVYLVWSKADQLVGFDAYFDDLDATGRAQVWGTTFAADATIDAFTHEFRLLLARLDERLVERLQAERSAERRALIGSFPLQVASLEEPIGAFLREAFSGSRLDPAPFLRGVYITSATQEGTPIDRVTGMLARSFGLDQRRAPSLRPIAGRSYFLTRLLREVILGEALLVTASPRVRRRRRLLRVAGFSAVGAATLTLALLIGWAEIANRAAIARADEALAAYRGRLAGAALDPVSSDDLPRITPILDQAASLPAAASAPDLLGLSQAAKLRQSGELAYVRALQRILLPRLLWRLEQQMRAHLQDPDFLYQATRVYLMLGGDGPLDPALVRAWMSADWQALYPGTLNDALRARLARHLDALLARPLPPVPLDGDLVQTARATFSRVTPAARIYSRIKAGASTAAPDFSPLSVLGPDEARYFVRPSGKPLSDAIPGFLTGAGFHAILLPNLPATTRAVAGESWVLGHDARIPTEGPEVAQLEQAVTALWVADAERAWDGMLNDLALAGMDGRNEAIENLYVLSSPRSPMRDLILGIDKALTISAQTRPKPDSKGLIIAAARAAPSPADDAASGFETHERSLLDLSTNPSSLDAILRLVEALDRQLGAGAGAGAGGDVTAAGGDPAQLLIAEAGRQPMPLSRWLRQIAASGSRTLDGEARSAASSAYAAPDGADALCHEVVDGHFPFDPHSSEDAPIGDFARLFAPGGALDGFVKTSLAAYVDARGGTWRPQPAGGVSPPFSGAALAAFQRASVIRDAFFPAGAQPLVSFTLQAPDGADGNATLALGGTAVGAGAARTVSLSWPGPDGMTSVALRVRATASPGSKSPTATTALTADGPWALFRLLRQGSLVAEADQAFRLTFPDVPGDPSFVLRPGSTRNPFGRDLLAGFRCPVLR